MRKKNKIIAALLAFTLGAFGVHKFYLRDVGGGLFYIFLYAVTSQYFAVSALLGLIDGIRYITMGEEEFDEKFNQKRFQNKYENRRNRRKSRKEYQQLDKPSSVRRKKKRRIKSNAFKKNGIKKYRDFEIEEALLDFEKALKINSNDPKLHFFIACCYALLENKENAFRHIYLAVQNGFTDFDRINNDDNLAFLRIQPEFKMFRNSNFQNYNLAEVSSEFLEEDLLLVKLSKLSELRKKGIVTESDYKFEREKLLKQA